MLMFGLHLSAAQIVLLRWVLIGAFADALVGVGRSFVKGTFDLALLGRFLVTNIGAVLAPVLLLGLLAASNPAVFGGFFTAACWTAYATFVGAIFTKFGLPLALAQAAIKAAQAQLGQAGQAGQAK
jgi:hypothetical protein